MRESEGQRNFCVKVHSKTMKLLDRLDLKMRIISASYSRKRQALPLHNTDVTLFIYGQNPTMTKVM